MASSFFSSLRALARVSWVPANRGAVAAALMARRAAGPEMPPPFSRSSCKPATVSATARAVSRSMRSSWMPFRLRLCVALRCRSRDMFQLQFCCEDPSRAVCQFQCDRSSEHAERDGPFGDRGQAEALSCR